MIRRRNILARAFFGILFFFLLGNHFAFAQEQYFKFPVTVEGVYKISSAQLNEIGISDIRNISIYGNAGMLDQNLDSVSLGLREIPVQVIDNELYFFLEGPHTVRANENTWTYHHHHYTDTLYYLIGSKTPSKNILLEPSSTYTSTGSVYQILNKKEETINILSSGRKWYGSAFNSGQAYNMQFDLPASRQGDLLLQSQVMAQSLQSANFSLSVNGQNRANFSIPSIPNSIYGIKGREENLLIQIPSQSQNTLSYTLNFQTADVNGTAYIDYISVAIPFNSNNLPAGIFHHLGDSPILITKPANLKTWKVRNMYDVKEVESNSLLSNGEKVVTFNPQNTPSINQWTSATQNLRNESINSTLIIISPEALLSEANRLANHKNSLGISARVVRLSEIFDAFGYGSYDIVAIRNFLAYHYHQSGQLKHVLFFGKGTFDYKRKITGGRPNLVPSYSSRNSLNPLATYSSDDFFGFLDFGQGEWEESTAGDESMKIGVGRIPAINLSEAREAVNKIIAYESKKNLAGDWKRRIAFFADDGDNNIHLNDAENHARFLSENHPEYILEKIYLDRYEQIRSAGRQSSPQAREALKTTVEEGLLILNYIGHGNETTLTAEQVFQISDFRDWPENELLPLLVTATCEFGRHDSPFLRSGAEEMLFAPNKGAIGLLTTGRPVFSSINFALNKAFIEDVFQEENGERLDLGEIFKRTKNNSLNGAFNRNFSLLGDPSLKLAIPDLNTTVKEIQDVQLELSIDTLRAMQQVRIQGEIQDPMTGAKIMRSGTFNLEIRDKKIEERTLGDESTPTSFLEEGNVLFNGEGVFTNGEFDIDVFIPQNIDYDFGEGKLRIFAILDDGLEAMGANNITIGGTAASNIIDTQGPEVNLKFGYEYGEDLSQFKAYNIKLQAELSDESGINISSNNLGQDILLYINDQEPINLNRFYRSTQNTFKQGILQAPVSGLQEGTNQIIFEVWDNVGNSTIVQREVIVDGSQRIKILENITYPNPTSELSKFKIKHNRPGENLMLQVRVFTLTGSEIFKANRRYVMADYLLDDFEWKFFHSKTNYPVKGTYIYELQLTSELDNTMDRKSGKIIIK